MSNLVVSCLVGRPIVGGGDLQLENPGTYRVVEVGPGAVSWRRETAVSPYVHGEALVAAVKDVQVAPLAVRVYGTTAANLESRTATMLEAFEQFSYNLNITIDGVSHVWRCQPADYGPVNGLYDPYHLRSLQQVYRFLVRRHPVPIAGST